MKANEGPDPAPLAQTGTDATAAAQSASEIRYRRLFESAPVGILILDAATGLVVDVNPFLIGLLAFSREAFLGKKLWELGFFKDLLANKAKFAELLATSYVRYEDLPMETADGRRIEVEFISNVYLVDQQKVIQCNIRDITAHKRLEAALRQEQTMILALMENLPNHIYFKDTASRFLRVNLAMARLFGFDDPAQMIGKSDADFFTAEHAQAALAGEQAIVRTGQPLLDIEEKETWPDGSETWVLTSKLPLRDAAGRIIGTCGISSDITARRQAREAQARLALAVEHAAETIVITDVQGTICYANPAFLTVTGYSRSEAYGQNPRILQSGKHDAEFYRKMWAQLASGQVWSGRLINRRKDGRLYEEEATISPVLDTAGSIINYVAVKRDITREVALEEQNRQAVKMEAIGRLAGGVAHDFNNKLQIILGCVEMLLKDMRAEHPFRSDLLDIQEAARRSADLTRQLLTFSRQQAIAPEVLDLNAAISGSLSMLGRLIGENIRLRFVPQPDLGRIFINPGQLDQILVNLAVNARDAITGAGTISIAARNRTLLATDCQDKSDFVPPGDYVELTFCDDGAGMPPETLAHIFEPFFTTKGLGQGTGLGLATIYGIIKQNTGAITVQSAPRQGTCFTIYLPRSRAAALPAAGEAEECMPSGTETVLVVEDAETLLKLVQRTLVPLGYTILKAVTPRQALQMCDQHPEPIHLLLTDVIMPDMSGKDLAEYIQKLRPGIRTLFMSGYPADIIEQHGHLPAGLSVIQKPFSNAALAQRVRTTLDASPKPPPA